MTIADEMPGAWVADLVAAVERRGWTVEDAHESALTLTLGPRQAAVLDAEPGCVLVIGWTERYGVDWGISADGGATVAETQPVTEDAGPEVIAAAVDRLLLTGRPDARLVRHAVPDVAPASACTCEAAAPCGGIVPDADCPEHGGPRSPRMWWHWEGPACTPR
ncbi:hypothetical protein ACNFR7_10535 [Streptomyces sp. RM1]